MICNPCGLTFKSLSGYEMHCDTELHRQRYEAWRVGPQIGPLLSTSVTDAVVPEAAAVPKYSDYYHDHVHSTPEQPWHSRDAKFPVEAPPLEAKKSDGYKVRLELITPSFLAALGRVLTFGASKYAAHNWAKGFDWSRLIGALERHVEAFKSGEDWDPETGEHHLAHAACEVMFLLEHATRGLGRDDRLKLPAELPVPADVLERRAAALSKVRKP